MEEILVNQNGNIATVTINRPEVKNAVTSKMWDDLTTTFTELGYDDSIRAVIVTGAGDDFCSGADVSAMGSNENEVRLHQLEAMRIVGFPLCPYDASKEIKDLSKTILPSKGGSGVIRDFYDFLINN